MFFSANVGRKGNIDRSPCGAGTCARIAAEYFKGRLKLRETFVTEGILGTIFKARVVQEVDVPSGKAVIPEISGRAFITGMHHFVVDGEDPLKHGFRL